MGQEKADQVRSIVSQDNIKKFFSKRASISVGIALKFIDLHLKKDSLLDLK